MVIISNKAKDCNGNNYTGIFDMSGNAFEYMMAGVEEAPESNTLASGLNINNNSGFNGKNIDGSIVSDGINLSEDLKYYDIYPYSTNVMITAVLYLVMQPVRWVHLNKYNIQEQ